MIRQCYPWLLAASATSPHDLAELERCTQRAQRELEDVKHAIRGTK